MRVPLAAVQRRPCRERRSDQTGEHLLVAGVTDRFDDTLGRGFGSSKGHGLVDSPPFKVFENLPYLSIHTGHCECRVEGTNIFVKILLLAANFGVCIGVEDQQPLELLGKSFELL